MCDIPQEVVFLLIDLFLGLTVRKFWELFYHDSIFLYYYLKHAKNRSVLKTLVETLNKKSK